MQRQVLGSTGYEVSAISMGCVTFGREIDEATSRQVLDRAWERNINFFDTAAAYAAYCSMFSCFANFDADFRLNKRQDFQEQEIAVVGSQSIIFETTLCFEVIIRFDWFCFDGMGRNTWAYEDGDRWYDFTFVAQLV